MFESFHIGAPNGRTKQPRLGIPRPEGIRLARGAKTSVPIHFRTHTFFGSLLVVLLPLMAVVATKTAVLMVCWSQCFAANDTLGMGNGS